MSKVTSLMVSKRDNFYVRFFGVLVMLVGLSVSGVWGQTPFTATYTFGSNGNVASFTYNGTNYLGITMNAISKVGVTTSSSADNFRATTWPTAAAVDAGKYIGFTIDAVSGYKFTVNTISFGVGRSGTGTRNTVWKGSSDSYVALINNYTTLNASITNSSGVLSNPDGTSAYTGNILTLSSGYTDISTSCGFRMYMYSSEAGTGTAGLAGPITISGTFELTVSSYTVSYNSNGGSGTMTDASSPYTPGANVTVLTNTFTRSGFVFSGWNTAANGSGTSYANASTITGIAANTTLYAQWVSTDATLSALSSSAGTLSPSFSASTEPYTASVLNSTGSITVTPTRNQANATIQAQVNGGGYSAVTSGSASGALALNVGENTVNVLVTAQDGATTKTYTITVTREAALTAQAITFDALSAVTYGVAPFVVSATGGGSGNPVTFTSSDATVATCTGTNGTTVTILKAGSCSIYANQAGNGSYNSAPQVAQTLTVNTKALTIPDAAVTNKTYDGTNAAVITGTLTGIINSDDVTLSGTGTFADVNVANGIAVTSTSTLGGTKAVNYTLTQPTGLTANITKANQTITGVAATATKYVGDANYTFAAASTTSGTNALSYLSSDPAVASIDASSGLVQILTTGTTTITVSQAGSTNYNAATNATQTLTVNEPDPLIDFDTAGNWTAGSVAITSYALNHTYIQNNWTFTGGNALRNTTTAQDGFAGALGTYSWRLENASGVSWTATYNAQLATNKKFTGFGFDARRWDGSPVPAYTVEYSLNGGTSWDAATSIGSSGVIDNAALNNASNWITFNQSVSSNAGLPANNFVVRVKSAGTTERIMIDNFTYQITTLPLFTGTGEWTANGNWNTGSAPASDAQVVIDGDITINSSVSAGNITINSGKSLTISAGKQLTVTSGIVNNGTLLLKSDAAGTATLIDSYSAPTITATVQQHVTAGRNWYMSAPISAAGYGALNKGNVVEWNEGTKHWDDVTSGTLTPGKGYIQVSASSSGTIDFTGTTNSGPTTPITLTYNGVSQAGFNLVGNPYPSYLDWTLVNSGNASANMTTGTMWYRTINLNDKSAWTPNTAYSLNTIVYNGTRFYKVTTAGASAASGGPTTALTNIQDGSVVWNYEGSIYIFATVNSAGVPTPSTVSNLIPPMQAFWVKTSSRGGSFSFNNTMRSHNTGDANALKAPKNTASDMKLLRLKVTNGSGVDESIIYSSANALNTFDTSDSPKWFNTSSNQPEIYTQVGNEKLAINAMNEIGIGTEIPLGFFTEKANTFAITASEIKNFDSSIQILLKDKLTSVDFDLTNGKAYEFNSAVVNDVNRFSIIFRTLGSVNALDNTKLTNTNVFVNANGEIVIKTSAPLSTNANATVYNAFGQLVNTQSIINGKAVINVARTAGVYFVTVTSNGITSTQKLIIK